MNEHTTLQRCITIDPVVRVMYIRLIILTFMYLCVQNIRLFSKKISQVVVVFGTLDVLSGQSLYILDMSA